MLGKTDLNDAAIIKAIKSGNNDAALKDLYKTILPRIKKYILHNNGDEEEAKDIFQDAVIIFFKQIKLEKYDESKEVAGFIFHVARNLWINRIKRKNKQSSFDDLGKDYEDNSNSLQDLITDEKAKAIETLLSSVGEECKQLLKYSIFEKFSMKEICEKMGYSSENVAKTYNYRCKQKLVQLVKDNKSIIELFKGE
jgi:RNA polymerase sigma factor (sigma-70 family)